jgi:homoserine kinase
MAYEEDSEMLASVLTQKFPDFIVKILNFDNSGLIIER